MKSDSNKISSLFQNHLKLSIIIFSLFFSWLLAFTFEGQVLYTLAKKNNFNLHNMMFIAMGLHFAGLFLSGFFIKTIQAARHLLLFSIISCILGGFLFFFHLYMIWIIALFAMSFLSGASVAAWGFYFKYFTPPKERMKTAANVLIYSNILMILLNIAAIHISSYIGLAVSILILFIALFFTKFFKVEVEQTEAIELIKKGQTSNLLKPLLFLCIFIMVITINSGLMYQVINPAFQHHKILVSWYWALPYIIALYIIKIYPNKINRTYMLYTGIAMIGFSFVFFMILDRSVISYLIINTLMLGACGVYDLFWWSILGEMLDFTDNPAKILGIGLSANVLGVLIGGVLGNEFITRSVGKENISAIAIVIVFITIIILPPLHKQLTILLKNHAFLTVLSEKAPAEITKTMDNFTIMSQLTKREIEVVGLLLKGRTYKMIANELFLSENTIKTHIKNIYSKLNVKSKMELIQLINKEK